MQLTAVSGEAPQPRAAPITLDLITLPALWGVELLILWLRMWDYGPVNTPVLVLLSVLLYVPLFWRRRLPLPVLAWTVVSSTVFSLVWPGFHPLFCIWLALFAAAAHSSRRTALSALAIAFVPAGLNAAESFRDTRDPTDRFVVLVAVMLFLTLSNLAAYGVGRWTRWSVAQRELVARLAAARAESEERRRIARELHDVVAHAVSLMSLQAAGAERTLSTDPDRARAALRRVSELGEQASNELRDMLGYLAPTASPQQAGREASMRLQDIGRLIDQLRSAGREVVLSLRGQPRPLDPATDEAAYRIVQEALTNAVKYADPNRPVRIDVSWHSDEVGMRVLTQGRAGPENGTPTFSTGNGIRGMHERARAVGGTVSAVPTRDGQFRVTATLPVSRRSGHTPRPRRTTLASRVLQGRP